MKGAAWIVIGLMTLLAARPAEAAEVQVLWQEHRVWGHATGHDADGNPLTEAYDIQDATAVSGSATADYWWGGGWVTNYVESSAGDFGVEAVDGSGWIFTGCYAVGRSQYVFRPLETELPLHFTGQVQMHSFENEVSFELYDEQTSELIDARSWVTESYLMEVDWIGEYLVDPGREYRLVMRALVAIGDWPGVTSRLNIDLTPEPGSVVLMCTALVLLRRRSGV